MMRVPPLTRDTSHSHQTAGRQKRALRKFFARRPHRANKPRVTRMWPLHYRVSARPSGIWCLTWENLGGPPGTRTPNLRIKSPLLCQIELEARRSVAMAFGVTEGTRTPSLQDHNLAL